MPPYPSGYSASGTNSFYVNDADGSISFALAVSMKPAIEIHDAGLNAALNRLQQAVGPGIRPLMQQIGDDMVARIRGRFASGTDPDGADWAANSEVTMQRYLAARSGLKKSGAKNAKGAVLAANKKPLTGVTRALSTQTAAQMASATTLEIVNAMPYAAVQQFGAKMGEFCRYYQLSRLDKYGSDDFRRYAGMRQGHPIPWGNIPPRRFMPLSPGGKTLSPAEVTLILAQAEQYLQAAAG
jgi:phage gpG-like protein